MSPGRGVEKSGWDVRKARRGSSRLKRGGGRRATQGCALVLVWDVKFFVTNKIDGNADGRGLPKSSASSRGE